MSPTRAAIAAALALSIGGAAVGAPPAPPAPKKTAAPATTATTAADALPATAAAAPAAPEVAPTFRGSGARTGAGTGEIPARPGLRWTFATGGELGYPGQPVLAGGLLYVGSGDGNVYAVNAKTGVEAWRFKTGGGVYASPLVTGGLVLVGSYDGAVYGLDAASGYRRWTARTGDLVESSACLTGGGLAVLGSFDRHVYAFEPATGHVAWKRDAGDAVYGAPACDGGLVFAGAGERLLALREADGTVAWEAKLAGDYVTIAPAVSGGTVVLAGQTGRVWAFDAKTGAPRWKADGAGRTRDAVAVGSGLVFACGLTGGCVALDLADGARRWSWRSLHGTAGAPVVAGGHVYVPANVSGAAVVYALDAATGLVQWDYRLDAPTRTTPLLADGVLYGGTEAGVVWALSLDAARAAPSGLVHTGAATFRGGFTRTGATDRGITETPRVLWTARTGADVGHPGGPVLAGGLAVTGSADGGVYAFSAGTGDEIWRFDTGGPVSAPATVVDGIVYVGSSDRHLYALDLASGALRWKFRARAEIAGAVCVLDGRIVAGSDDGRLHGLDAATGKPLWERSLGERLRATPACEAGRAFALTTAASGLEPRLHAVDAARGEPVWSKELGKTDGVTTGVLVAGGGVLVATTSGALRRFDKDTGAPSWSSPGPGEMRDALAASGALAFACSSAADANCQAVDLSSGVTRWKAKLGGSATGAPVVGSGVAIVPVAAAGATRLVALRASSGAPAWTLELPGPSRSTPALSAGLLLHGNEHGAIYLVGLAAPAGPPLLTPWEPAGAGRPGYELFRGEASRLGAFRGAAPSAPRVLWSARAGSDIGYPGQAVVFDGRVFTGSGSGGLYAFDERSGKELWHYENGDGAKEGIGIYTSPTYWNGLVLAGSYDRSVYAVDARTGKLRWRFKTGGLLEASICVEGTLAMIASFDGRLYAVEAASGREVWSYNARGALGVSPACAAGRVYGGGAGDGTAGQLFALEAATGREVWTRALEERPTLAVTYAGEALYAAGDGGTIWALEPATGRELWHAPGPGLMREAVAVADRKLYACAAGGTCGAYRLPGGEKIWSVKIGGASRGAPLWAGGVVLATAVDADRKATHLVALDASTGAERWRLKLDGTTRSSAGLYGGRVYVGTETGVLHAIGDRAH